MNTQSLLNNYLHIEEELMSFNTRITREQNRVQNPGNSRVVLPPYTKDVCPRSFANVNFNVECAKGFIYQLSATYLDFEETLQHANTRLSHAKETHDLWYKKIDGLVHEINQTTLQSISCHEKNLELYKEIQVQAATISKLKACLQAHDLDIQEASTNFPGIYTNPRASEMQELIEEIERLKEQKEFLSKQRDLEIANLEKEAHQEKLEYVEATSKLQETLTALTHQLVDSTMQK